MISLSIDLAEKSVTIIGGGEVAARRVEVLVKEKARITIISPFITEELNELVERGEVHWKARNFIPNDIEQSDLLVAATNNVSVNDHIVSHSRHVPLVNRVDGGSGGNIHFPAQLSRGKMMLSVTTQGASPKLAARIREEWKEKFPPSFENYINFLDECRQYLKGSVLRDKEKKIYLDRMLDSEFLEEVNQQSIMEEIHKKEEQAIGCTIRKKDWDCG